jgi:hypothetical protein
VDAARWRLKAGRVLGPGLALVLLGCGGGIGVSQEDSGTADASTISPDGGDAGSVDGGDATVEPVCGDGVLEGDEACDGSELGGEDCQSQGFAGGTLGCHADCTFDHGQCTGGCGNDLIEDAEQCDGVALGGETCATVSAHSQGDLACAPDCTFDVSGCHTCGDGLLDGPEECDGAELDGETCVSQGYTDGDLGCAGDCTFDVSGCSTCGDGVISGPEACDGNDLAGQSCNSLGFNHGTLVCASDCTLDPSDCSTCGDGVVSGAEQCDGAALGGATCVSQGFTHGDLGCTANCVLDTSQCYTCGDSVISGPEECDGVNHGGQTCQTLGYVPGGTLSCDSACLFDRSQCTPSVCTPQSASNPLGRKTLQFYVHPAVDVQIATEAGAALGDAGPSTPGAHEAAVTFDQLQANDGSAGFLLTRDPATGGVRAEAYDLLSRLTAMSSVSAVETLSPGSPATSHDGYDMVVSITAVLQTSATTNLSAARNAVLAALFGRPQGDFTLPGAAGPTANRFVVSLAVQWRAPVGWVAVIGAVAREADYDAGGATTFRVKDAGGGTGLAEASATTATVCFRYDQTRLPMADIIWVLDETGSMTQKLQEIATESVGFFNTAAAYHLDFRMGVVNVEPSNNGVFCTGAGQSADHFLGPSDLTAFQACVEEPWGAGAQAGGFEFGITQGENALSGHLPRGSGPDQVRPDATLAIIYVSDERAQELKDDCGATGAGLVNVDPTCLQTVIGPTVALLEPDHPVRPGRAYALVQPPPQGCTGSFSEVGQGYTDVVSAVGGQTHAICPTDLGPFMDAMLQDIIAAAAPTKLPHRPIGASLAVAKLDRSVSPPVSQPLARSSTDGFDYRPSSNGVVFLNQDFSQLPYEMVIAYEHWLTAERCGNGADDDGDSLVDCADTGDCTGQPCNPYGAVCQGGSCTCPGSSAESACGDGVDNDCDGDVDCADADCNGVAPCEDPEVTCDDGLDNDADGAVDCDDSDCPTVASEATCGDGLDNDCDGDFDCADPDCTGVGYCEQPEVTCDDGLDNDGDGLIDGQDLMDCGSAVYQESFDTNPSAWAFSCEWEWGTPGGTVGPGACVSGSCVGLDLDDDYDSNHAWSTCHLTSPTISLAGTSQPLLQFQSWLETEAGYDGCNLKVSAGGGAWTVVSGVTPAYNDNLATQDAWSGDTFAAWQPFEADLSPWIGQSIRLRFECYSDNIIEDPGWYVDDLIVLD